ncbi:MAG: hypothetical protein IJ197_04535 [Bacteroidaceae bacterium]|nr:hypothetical protein [Bacteroidaceae bacterium]
MQIVQQIGNVDLLKRDKVLFLCSKRTPLSLYDDVFRWTDRLTTEDCIACFNSTEMEAEVLKALLVARVPTVLYVMNRFTDVNNIQVERALQEGRLLIVVLRRDESRNKGQTPRLRNEYVLSQCKRVVCGYVNKNGSVFGLLAGRENVRRLIGEGQYTIAAEPEVRHERWTVGEDKVLLRMFYADMGIHAIHKRLQRTYQSVYTRIRSITQPEDVLKGREFEDYVLTLFNPHDGGELILKEWQGDKSLGDFQPENNRNPDFVFEYQGKGFAVECKWRERLKRDLDKDLFSTDKIAIYEQFATDRSIPVYIVLGVGGEPSNPELLYNIPLSEIPSLLSHKKSIVEYLRPSAETPFCITDFISEDTPKQKKAYTIEEKRANHPNAYRPWTKEDDDRLLQLSALGTSIPELCEIFGRNRGAITSRLKKLHE